MQIPVDPETCHVGLHVRWTILIQLLFLLGRLYCLVCGLAWLQERTPKRHVLKRDIGGPILPFNEHENLLFDMNKTYEL